MLIPFMIVPIVMGIYRYKELDFSYRLLLYSTFFTLINQCLYFLFKKFIGVIALPLWNNILNYFTILCWLPLFVFIVVSWTKIRIHKTIATIYFLICIIFILTEIYFLGLGEIRASLALSFCKLLALLIFIFSLNDISSQKTINRYKWSRLLLIVPFIIEVTYDISFELFMYYLYADKIILIFQKLYLVMLGMGAITFLFTAQSIFWAPKKEVFI
jgi:hypothetical protein